ncbi:MAG: pyruvate ferredoxin oxidoreductase [Pseudomonadota bacterium]
MKQVIEGSHAISEAVKLSRVQVVSGYPITPQTHIIEAISEYCANGSLKARFIPVESEHSAMAAIVGAASTGVRAFTATSSHGLALMHEMLHWASAARLPLVMGEVNRALGPGWNIWTDQTDSLAQRDTGWIQLYCENGQEALDTTIMAFRLAELVNLPVMVIIDAFFISHTFESVDIPSQEEVDRFLPPYEPRFALDTANPFSLFQMAPPKVFMEMRESIHKAMIQAEAIFSDVEDEFHAVFNRRYGAVEAIGCEDADIILVISGSATSTARQARKDLEQEGKRLGMLKIKEFRPFPGALIRAALARAKKVAVLDRNFSFGSGGIFAQEVRSALQPLSRGPVVFDYIAGLGGRDITTDTIREIYEKTAARDLPLADSEWIGLSPYKD